MKRTAAARRAWSYQPESQGSKYHPPAANAVQRASRPPRRRGALYSGKIKASHPKCGRLASIGGAVWAGVAA